MAVGVQAEGGSAGLCSPIHGFLHAQVPALCQGGKLLQSVQTCRVRTPGQDSGFFREKGGGDGDGGGCRKGLGFHLECFASWTNSEESKGNH